MTYKELLGEAYKEGMTEEEICAFVKSKISGLENEVNVFKTTSQKNASEAADYKKKYSEKLTDEEKAKLNYDALVKRNQELEKNSKIAENRAKYIALGYDEQLAEDTAIALVEGNTEKVFANQNAYQKKLKDDFNAKLLEKTPNPPAPKNETITKEAFNKMGYEELVKLKANDPTTYEKLSKE